MEAIEEEERFDGAHAMGEAFEDGGGGRSSQGAASVPQANNEGAGDRAGPRPMLTDSTRPDLSTPAGLGALRS
ncbi:hypothetical protein PR002_g9813 [Phytophthora rubi]|uniref:Uncharacterized protein n=1 Tax=Phytophthora rubi TaxID=129364 RepID=A0A6A3MMD3_9STRA|nr:hypothetical protein PR002_g9813 [Phytophthora rubi]